MNVKLSCETGNCFLTPSDAALSINYCSPKHTEESDIILVECEYMKLIIYLSCGLKNEDVHDHSREHCTGIAEVMGSTPEQA